MYVGCEERIARQARRLFSSWDSNLLVKKIIGKDEGSLLPSLRQVCLSSQVASVVVTLFTPKYSSVPLWNSISSEARGLALCEFVRAYFPFQKMNDHVQPLRRGPQCFESHLSQTLVCFWWHELGRAVKGEWIQWGSLFSVLPPLSLLISLFMMLSGPLRNVIIARCKIQHFNKPYVAQQYASM